MAGYVDRPEVVLLRDDGPARWIVPDDPVELVARKRSAQTVIFRTGFRLETVPDGAVLEFVCLGSARVFVGGREIDLAGPESGDWRHPRRVDLDGLLAPGPGEIAIAVTHDDGPSALRARCDALGLGTGAGWQSSRGQGWTPVRLAPERPVPAPALEVPSGSEALASRVGIWLPVFLAGFALALRHRSAPLPGIGTVLRPERLQWVLVAAMLVMGANNFWRLHPDMGFDVSGHLDYVRFIVQRGALPLADDGWQMFQMPLFYLVAALPYALLQPALDAPALATALRWIPLLCGALQVLVARRALAAVFADRPGLQAAGLVFVAFFPVNVYMSQYLGNEPMAALFSAIALTLLLEMLREPDRARSTRRNLLLILALSAAILSKITAVLLVPAALAVLLHARPGRAGVGAGARLLLFVLVLAGWPLARNLVEYGTPFVFASSSVDWWQDPGYRVPADLWRFGRALERPVFSSTAGFWNALHATAWTDGQMGSMIAARFFPPWNLPYVLALPWLALPLAATMMLGAVRGLLRRDPVFGLATACGLLYLAALLQQWLALPIWSTAKASYTLGLLPLYAVLFAGGLDAFARNRWGTAVASGMLASWAVFVFLGFLAG